MSLATIDAHLLLRVFYTSIVAGVGVCVVFALTVLGFVRSVDMRRLQRSGAATSYAILAAVGLALSASIIIYGLVLLSQKS